MDDQAVECVQKLVTRWRIAAGDGRCQVTQIGQAAHMVGIERDGLGALHGTTDEAFGGVGGELVDQRCQQASLRTACSATTCA